MPEVSNTRDNALKAPKRDAKASFAAAATSGCFRQWGGTAVAIETRLAVSGIRYEFLWLSQSGHRTGGTRPFLRGARARKPMFADRCLRACSQLARAACCLARDPFRAQPRVRHSRGRESLASVIPAPTALACRPSSCRHATPRAGGLALPAHGRFSRK